MTNLQVLRKEISGLLLSYTPAQAEMLTEVLMYKLENWASQYGEEMYDAGQKAGLTEVQTACQVAYDKGLADAELDWERGDK